MSAQCQVEWCVCEAVEGESMCAVHRNDPVAAPLLGLDDWTFIDDRKECEYCDGDGTCTCSDCDREHDCGHCDGTGFDDGFEGYREAGTGRMLSLDEWMAEIAARTGVPLAWVEPRLTQVIDADRKKLGIERDA